MASSASGQRLLPGILQAPVIATGEALSFWGGVDPATGRVIDIHHPLCGVCLSGAILVMPTSRGSCSGSGVILDMILSGLAPAALVFSEAEDVLTLGALIAAEMFDKTLPVLRLPPAAFAALSEARTATIGQNAMTTNRLSIPLVDSTAVALELTGRDRAVLAGVYGDAARLAMRIICAMAAIQGARRLVDVAQVHIDGCIYASAANLTFARTMADLGAIVRVPTTTNAISVDQTHWRAQGVPPAFGMPAAQLADAYTRMGCSPSFTCAPYLLDSAPASGDYIAWAESNAVIFANTVLGARTAKHPDFLDLCIALTGRAALAGPYLDAHRRARRVITVDCPDNVDDSFWPLIGYLAGSAAPDRIPLLTGLAKAQPSHDDLKALCAAFGTTSAAPMLHIAGITPEAGIAAVEDADEARITRDDMARVWSMLNSGAEKIDLVAFGSPHASLTECQAIAEAFGNQCRRDDVDVIITAGRSVIAAASRDGTLTRLRAIGIRILPDLCWCSISEPVFPPQARTVMTNSGKYAHYGPGLSGRTVRFGALADCVQAAVIGKAPAHLPDWLNDA